MLGITIRAQVDHYTSALSSPSHMTKVKDLYEYDDGKLYLYFYENITCCVCLIGFGLSDNNACYLER